jgi:hypothetical protein
MRFGYHVLEEAREGRKGQVWFQFPPNDEKEGTRRSFPAATDPVFCIASPAFQPAANSNCAQTSKVKCERQRTRSKGV